MAIDILSVGPEQVAMKGSDARRLRVRMLRFRPVQHDYRGTVILTCRAKKCVPLIGIRAPTFVGYGYVYVLVHKYYLLQNVPEYSQLHNTQDHEG
jgi:hypothetical protein